VPGDGVAETPAVDVVPVLEPMPAPMPVVRLLAVLPKSSSPTATPNLLIPVALGKARKR
jgi:hypothetical protein